MESSDRFDTYLLETDSESETEISEFTPQSPESTDSIDGEIDDLEGDQVDNQVSATESTVKTGDHADDDNLDLTDTPDLPLDDHFEAAVKGNGHTVDEEAAGDSATVDVESQAEPAVSPFRAASLSVADAIESAVTTSEHRHDALQGKFVDLAEQQASADEKQQQLSRSVASIQSWQSQSDGRLNQLDLKQRSIIESQKTIGESVSSVLTNQKTSAKCYNDVMASLNAIQATQQFDQQRLDELTKQFDDRLSALRKTLVVGGVIIGALAAVGILVSIL